MFSESGYEPGSLRTACAICLLLCVPANVRALEALSWEAARERSARSGEFLLVEVGASWCHACNVFAIRTLADSCVQRALSTDWILVDVDVDRRPDLHHLFHARAHEGLPSLHFLDSTGKEVLRSGSLNPEELVDALNFARGEAGAAVDLLPEAGGSGGGLDSLGTLDACMHWARERLVAEAASVFGGFGSWAKYLQTVELDLLLALTTDGDDRAAVELRRLLAGVLPSHTYDAVEGGFHRYSGLPDWSSPHYEKLLVDQAVMIEALSIDARVHPSEADANLKVVRQIRAFLMMRLHDPSTGLFYGSVNADVLGDSSLTIVEPGESYYSRRPIPTISLQHGAGKGARHRLEARRPGPAPRVDRTYLTSANARLASALILAGETFGDPSFTAHGWRILESIWTRLRDSDGGFLHWKADGGSDPALAEDLAEIGLLLLAAGGERNLARAQGLGQRLRDDFLQPDGGFRARAPAQRTDVPAEVGAEAARAIVFLAELSRATDDAVDADRARRAFRRLLGMAMPAEFAAVGLAARLGDRE